MSRRRFDPWGPLRGALRAPGDKSISHRAALIAAMGEGETAIAGYLDAADTRSSLAAITALGAEVEGASPAAVEPRIRIRGVGLRGAAAASVDVGNAGTLLTISARMAQRSAARGAGRLDGDDSIRRRPVDRIVEPLREMGARLRCREDRLPPLEIEGTQLHGVAYELPIASAQVKSCLLFAGLLAEGDTQVKEPPPTRDHTERMLAAAGAEIQRGAGLISVARASSLEPGEIIVPADFSSAAFFLVAALLVGGSELSLQGVGLNPTRTGLLAILERMGARFETEQEGERGGEPIGEIRVRSAPLRATEISGAEVPLAIDELPLVALAACFAEGTTRIGGAGELRRKESDRIATVTEALNALGGKVKASQDGMVIEGVGGLRGGAICSHGDHRIAMLGAIAGVCSREGVEVDGIEAAAVSYPRFEADLASLSGR